MPGHGASGLRIPHGPWPLGDGGGGKRGGPIHVRRRALQPQSPESRGRDGSQVLTVGRVDALLDDETSTHLGGEVCRFGDTENSA